jgi:hypothetical protein
VSSPEIWSSHSSQYQDYCRVGYDAVSLADSTTTLALPSSFCRPALPHHCISGLHHQQQKQQHGTVHKPFHACSTFTCRGCWTLHVSCNRPNVLLPVEVLSCTDLEISGLLVFEKCCGHFRLPTKINLEAVAELVEALRYKPEGRGLDSRWCHWNFSLI